MLLTCPSVSVVSAAAQKARLRALDGHGASSKSPSRIETDTIELLRELKDKSTFPKRGH